MAHATTPTQSPTRARVIVTYSSRRSISTRSTAGETDDAIAYDATLDRFLAATRHDLGIQMNANLLTEDDIIR